MGTLQDYRIATSKGLGGYEDRGVRAATGGRLTTAAGTTASLLEGRWPILRSRVPTDFYEGALVYRTGVGAAPTFTAADRVRQIGAEGYDGEAGKLIPDTDWVTAPLAGEEYELHLHGFEPFQQLTSIINEALRAIILVVDVEMTLVTDERGAAVPEMDADGLPLASWLKAPEQVLSVRSVASGGALPAINRCGPGMYRGAAWTGGGNLYLGATGHVWAQCYKPAFFHCRSDPGGVYGAQEGLQPGQETNEALPETNWVATGAVALAWESFDDQERGAQAVKAQRYAAAKQAFYQWQQDYFLQHPVDRTFVPYGAIA